MKVKTLLAVGVAAAFALPLAAQVSAAGDSIILAQSSSSGASGSSSTGATGGAPSGTSSVGSGPTGGTPSPQSAGEPKAPTAGERPPTGHAGPPLSLPRDSRRPGQEARRRRGDVRRRRPALRPHQRRAVAGPGPALAQARRRRGGPPAGAAGAPGRPLMPACHLLSGASDMHSRRAAPIHNPL